MKKYKDIDNNAHCFEDDCFCDNVCINEKVIDIINRFQLVEITEEEYQEITKVVLTDVQKKEIINQEAYNQIIEKYPLWKQMNIIRSKDLSEESLIIYNEMICFIDEIRAYAE